MQKLFELYVVAAKLYATFQGQIGGVTILFYR
jgi:hypothetical protein